MVINLGYSENENPEPGTKSALQAKRRRFGFWNLRNADVAKLLAKPTGHVLILRPGVSRNSGLLRNDRNVC